MAAATLAPNDFTGLITREERHNDMSGTPHGLITQAARMGELALIDGSLFADQEANVLVEYTVGSEFKKQRGYGRFVEFRVPMEVEVPGPEAETKTWVKARYALVRHGGAAA